MLTGKLKKVGGSTMVAIPPAVLDQLGLKADAKVELAVEGDRLVIAKAKRRKYTLDELIAQCDPSVPVGADEREWLDAPSVGREKID